MKIFSGISKIKTAMLLTASLTLTGCWLGGSGSGSGSGDEGTNTGVFVDSEVDGLEYFTSSGITGITNNKGKFNYKNEDIVTFKLGNFPLGSVGVNTDNNIVMPSSLLNSYGELSYDDRVNIGTNIAVLLQSIDNDRDHDNGIQIPQYFRDGFNSDNLINLKDATDVFGNKLESHLGGLPSISDSIARENIAKSLKKECVFTFGNLKAKNQPDCDDMANNFLLAIYAQRYANIARNYEYVINDIKAEQSTADNLEKAIKSATDLGASFVSIYENKGDIFKLGIETLKAMLTSFKEAMNLLDNADGKEAFSTILNVWKFMVNSAYCVSDGGTNINSCSEAVYNAISASGNIYKISESDVNKSVQVFLQYSELLKHGTAILSLAESNRSLLVFLIATAPGNEHAAKILFNTIALAQCGKDADFSQCVSAIGTSLATTVHDIYASTNFLSQEQALIEFTRNNVIYVLLLHVISENMAGKEGYTKNKMLSIINQTIEHNNINPVELDNRSIYNYFITPAMDFFQSEESAKEDFRNSKVVSSVYDFIKNSHNILKAMKSGLKIIASKNNIAVDENTVITISYKPFPLIINSFRSKEVDLLCTKNGDSLFNEKIYLNTIVSKSLHFNQTGKFEIKCELSLMKGVKINEVTTTIYVVKDNGIAPENPVLISPGNSNSPGSILTNLKPNLSWNATNKATYYTVAVRDMDTDSLVLNENNVVGTSLTMPTDLTAGHKYYWNIEACNDAGCSAWAEPLYFQTNKNIPDAPSLIIVKVEGLNAIMAWQKVDAADKYNVEVIDRDGNDNHSEHVSKNEIIIPNLIAGHRYKVKIKARVNGDYGNYSNYEYFEIGSETYDFYPSDASLNKSSVNAGDEITAYVDVNYSGNVLNANMGNVSTGYYFSENTRLDSSDNLLGTSDSNLGSDDTSDREYQTLNLPNNLSSGGTYYILFVVNYDDRFTETDESNNITYASFNITAQNPQICTPNDNQSRSCSISHGSGSQSQTCSSDGKSWGDYGSCSVTECDNGYSQVGNSCVRNIIVPVPQNLSTSVNGTTVGIAWTPVVNADEYRIKVYDTDDNIIHSGYHNNNSISIQNLEEGRRYKVKVRAYINNNYGNYSDYKYFEIAEVKTITPSNSCSLKSTIIMNVDTAYTVDVDTENYSLGEPISEHSASKNKVRGFWLGVKIPDGYYARKVKVTNVGNEFNPVIGLRSNCSYEYYGYVDDNEDGGSETLETGLTGAGDGNDGIYHIRMYHYNGSETPRAKFTIEVTK